MSDRTPEGGELEPIPFEEIARFPTPGNSFPVQVSFGPDDRVVTYLHDPSGGINRSLFVVDLDEERIRASGQANAPVAVELGESRGVFEAGLSVEEQLRRERSREVGLGVTRAEWAGDADALLVPLAGDLIVVRGLAEDPSRPVAHRVNTGGEGSGSPVAPKLSPDGTKLAFVRDGDLFVVPATAPAESESGDSMVPVEPVRLTTSGNPAEGLTNGVAEYVAQEEMDRADGFFWSPDSSQIAFTEVDERHIPVYRIVHQGSDTVGPGDEEDHRYPFAGKANAVVRLGVVSVDGGSVSWMDTGEVDRYLVRVGWSPDGRLLAEIESRDQTTLDLVVYDLPEGKRTLLHREITTPYLNLHDDLRVLSDGSFLWSSEASGFRHLVHYRHSGELITVLTSGDWQVDKLEGVDEERRLVYFTATKESPLERQLYAVSLDTPEAIVRITTDRGTHAVSFGRTGRYFADRHAGLDHPPSVQIKRIPSAASSEEQPVVTVHDNRDPRIDALGLVAPEIVSFPAADGRTTLYGLWYSAQPAASGPLPLVVWVYGGPGPQYAVDDWLGTAQMRAQALRRLGCNVLQVDNRGSARRGLAFESAIFRRFGVLEVDDQVAGVRWAVDLGLADPDRVAIYGWSYGGYMTLRCLELAGDTFCAGVAGAPVTHWDGYDTFYTERYMGMPSPEDNAAWYEDSSVLPHVDKITGELLLVHGLIDENVHFRHSARLVNRLNAGRKSYRLLCFPDERHLPRRLEDRAYMEEQVVGFLASALGLDVTLGS